MKIILSQKHDAYYNLSTEEILLNDNNFKENILFIYINANAIIIGRNQNIWSEINKDFVDKNKIQIVRRISGGGAVYQDLGNINFSFITSKNGSYQEFLKPIINFLQSLDLNAQFHGKNDLHIDGFKVSGNAQYKNKDRMFHHGTILYKSNLTTLSKALKPNMLKLKSKSIKSIRQRVSNIYDLLKIKLSNEEFTNKFINYFVENEKAEIFNISNYKIKEINDLMQIRKSHNWIFNKNPKFSFTNHCRFEGGTIELKLEVNENKISNLIFNGDFLSSNQFENIYKYFINKEYDKKNITNIVNNINNFKDYFGKITSQEIISLFFKSS